jgi:hypothetical protein
MCLLRRRTRCAGQATTRRVRRRRVVLIKLRIKLNKYDGSMGLTAASLDRTVESDIQLNHYS